MYPIDHQIRAISENDVPIMHERKREERERKKELYMKEVSQVMVLKMMLTMRMMMEMEPMAEVLLRWVVKLKDDAFVTDETNKQNRQTQIRN
jgi:hypothetical protein